jgi:recombination protein RecA
LLETRYGAGYVTAAGKEVPVVVRRAGRDAQIEFIRAYMELECHIGKERRRITVSSASERLLRQVHLMLLNLGIVSKLSHKRVRSYPDRNYWRLCIDGKDAARYVELIGFKTQARREQCAAWDTAYSNTNNDSIPNISALLRSLYDGLDTDRKANGLAGDYMNGRANPSYDKLREIVDKLGEADHPIKDYLERLISRHLYFDEVVSAETKEAEPTFDVVMPETHSFWSNAMISHNTTLAQHIVAEAQKLGGTAVHINMEHAVDLAYMQACGVDTSAVYFSQPDSGTDALNIVRKLVASNTVDLIVVDSVAALTSVAELDADAGDQFMGVQARMMSQNLKTIVPSLGLSKTALVFINQTRIKIGVMYGNPETTPGGVALRFYSSVRMRVARKGTLGSKGNEHGICVGVKVMKNKVAPPWQTAEFDIEWGKGISKESDMLNVALEAGIITSAGGYFKYQGENIGHGRENTKNYLGEHPELMDTIRAAALGLEEDDESDENS